MGAVYVLSPSKEWTEGFLVGRYPGVMGVGEHLHPIDVSRVTAQDTVVIIGGWDKGVSHQARLYVEKALHDSGATLYNGAGLPYSWSFPLPWEVSRT